MPTPNGPGPHRRRRHGTRPLAAALALLALTPAAAVEGAACPPAPVTHRAAEERGVTIATPDGRMAGTLSEPEGGPPRALALLLHGYTGARNEIPVAGGEGMFARTARAFAERGIATLRIDFLGSGASDGAWADTRFSHQARDAVRAADWLRAEASAPGLALAGLGYSQGGLVALRAAARVGPFDRLALWNPVMDPMTTFGRIFGTETILDGARRADGQDPGEIVGGTRLRPGFFAELVAADPIGDAAKADLPLLVVTGRRDPLVPDGAALAGQIAASRRAETRILDLDAGHDLGALREPELLDRVIRCTAAFVLGLR